jgi:sugar lactone lactonase YvrE
MTVTPTVEAELVVDARARIGEGPLWDQARGRLLWVDIAGGLIHAFDPRSGVSTALTVGQPVGSLALRKEGGLVAALRDGFGIAGRGRKGADGEPHERRQGRFPRSLLGGNHGR